MTWKTNHIEYRACKKKIRYDSYNHAMKEAKKIYRRTGEELHPYECRFCNGWHLSHDVWEDV